MKKNLWIIAVFALLIGAGQAYAVLQRPTPTVVGGATSGGTAVTLLTDSDGTLHTTASAASGSVQAISPNPAFVTSYAGTAGMTTVSSGSTTSFTSTTSVATTFPIVNLTDTAVVVNVTDGAGVYFLKNFSIAANSAVPAGWCYACVFTSGVKISANTASAVTAQFNGFQ